MIRQVVWAFLRLVVVLFLYLPVAYAFLIIIQISRPRFLEMNWDAYIWVTVLLLAVGYCLFHFSRTKEFGKLFLISVLGVSVLMMYEGQSYTISTQDISANALYVAFLFLIPAIHFILPSVWTLSLIHI